MHIWNILVKKQNKNSKRHMRQYQKQSVVIWGIWIPEIAIISAFYTQMKKEWYKKGGTVWDIVKN